MNSSAFLLCVSVVVVAMTTQVVARRRYVPDRCCVPDQFTADLKSTMTTYKYYDEVAQPDVRYSYDYINKRWSIYSQDAHNDTVFTRVAFDYENLVKLYETEEGCQIAPIQENNMAQYCTPANASYEGVYQYGSGSMKLSVDQWSYDYGMVPVRSVRHVTRHGCYPVSDVSGIVVRNTWDVEHGDPACIPWDDPTPLLRGKCYKSFHKHEDQINVVEFTVPFLTMDYRNLELGITSPQMFDVPDTCKKVKNKQWGRGNRLHDMYRLMLHWFNPHDPLSKEETRKRRRQPRS